MNQPDMACDDLIFLDETGFNTNMSRGYARALSGERAVVSEPVKRSINHSLVGAITSKGLITAMMVEGAIDGDAFKCFISEFLLPFLKPGKTVVMDNLPAHHVDGIEGLIESTGASVLYLPPYSPDLNPIEECWSKMKSLIRKWKPRAVDDLWDTVGKAMSAVTVSDCKGWFNHAGYFL
jgi:transposase